MWPNLPSAATYGGSPMVYHTFGVRFVSIEKYLKPYIHKSYGSLKKQNEQNESNNCPLLCAF